MVRWVFNSVDSLLPYRVPHFIAPGGPAAACARPAPCRHHRARHGGVPAHTAVQRLRLPLAERQRS